MDIKFLEFRKGENWVRGNVNKGEYTFISKLNDSESPNGIKSGRVSKLSIFKGERREGFKNEFVNYDRGWGTKPATEEEKKVYQEVLKFLEDAPKNRF